MKATDIINLANAGYTAQQIAGIMTAYEHEQNAPTPAPAPTPTPAPAPAPTPAPTPAPAPAPAPAPTPAPAPANDYNAIMQKLSEMQTAFISGAQQPKANEVTPESILASIINPPKPEK